MRNKIKQIMNKEEGFTLVELLAVIVILGIIVAIAIPAVSNVIDRADSDAEEAEEALIIDAARIYFVTEEVNDSYAPQSDSFTARVTVTKLKNEGYLENKKNHKIDKGTVTRTRLGDEGEYRYEYSFNSDEAIADDL